MKLALVARLLLRPAACLAQAALGMAAACAQAQSLPAPVAQALAQAGVPARAASIIVQPVAGAGAQPTTVAILQHHAERSVNPASVMKLVTTYAALDELGESFTWKNRVYLDGTLEAGVLRGNLILRGSGDPKLVLERIEDWFRQIQAQGIREVRGDIVLDHGVFELPQRHVAEFDDEPLRPYNALPDGLLVNFKSLIFTFTPNLQTGRVAVRTEPPIMGVELPLEVAGSAAPCRDWRGALQADFSSADRVRFAGAYPLACGERAWPVAYVAPEQYATRVIEAMWRQAGGQLSGRVRDGHLAPSARLLLTAESLPLSQIIADINKFSNNVMAQQLFLTLSAQPGTSAAPANFASSQQRLATWWRKRFPAWPAPVIENGSGLSRLERTSAAAINALLQSAAQHPQGQVFAQSLGIAGVDGTVAAMRDRNSHSAAIGQAQLKTGTLKDVSAVAGYALGQDGQRYSLVAIINHPNAAAARPALDALVEWVVKRQAAR